MKDKLMEIVKKVYRFLKANPLVTAVLGYAVVSLVLILIAMFALKEFVVSVCVLIIIEAAMAALLHKAEIWKHGILLAAQLVVAIVIKRIPLVIICMIAYVAATFALQFMAKQKKETSPKA